MNLRSDRGSATDTRKTAKADCEALVSVLVPFAEKMLREHGEFHPFAGGLSKTGKVELVGATNGALSPRAIKNSSTCSRPP